MKKVPVSIIVPSYNGLRFASQLIDCLHPYYQAGYEIILVEDGSDDGIKEAFLAAFPTATYVWQENAGVSAARYTGVQQATGEYIQMLDIDDTIEVDKLPVLYHHAVTNNLDVVYSGWREAFKKQVSGEVTYRDWIVGDAHDDVAQAIFNRWWFPPCSPIIKKESYLAVEGGDHSLRFIEDLGLWLKLYAHGYTFGYCEGRFSNYFKHENSNSLTTHRKTEYWWEDTCKVFIDTIRTLEKNKILNKGQLSAGLERLFNGNRNLAKFNLRKAIANWQFIIDQDPCFTPRHESKLFMTCFKSFGYPTAERIALALNEVKRKLFKKDNKDNIQGGDVYIAEDRKGSIA